MHYFFSLQYALRRRFSSGAEKKEHFMDHAADKYDRQLVEDVKVFLRVIR